MLGRCRCFIGISGGLIIPRRNDIAQVIGLERIEYGAETKPAIR